MSRTQVTKSPIHGSGLFAAVDISWGTKIIEYDGQVISDAEAAARDNDYIFELGVDSNIDGLAGGSDARFANHSREAPNAFVLRDQGRIWLVAGIEGIRKGEEITFDYGSDYYPNAALNKQQRAFPGD